MTDLDQRLAEAFEHRASLASGGIAPAAVTRAVRRQRMRTAAGSVVATVGVVATAAIVVFHQQATGGAGPAGSVTSAPPSWQPGTTIASLPFGKGTTVSLRYGDGYGASTSFDWCVQGANPGYSCFSDHSGATRDIQREGDASTFFGLAPENTTKVVVSVRGERPVTATLSKLDLVQPGLPAFDNPRALMFAAPGVTAYLDPTGALTKASTVEAFDGAGNRLAILSSRGTWDLAQAHPVSSPQPYPGLTSPGEHEWFWTAADGWSCLGRSAALDGRQQYGADVCYAPSTSTQLLRDESSATLRVFLVRVPATATSVHLVSHDGQSVDGAILDGGLVVLRVKSTGPVDPAVVTVRDSHGAILTSGAIATLPGPASADIVSGG